MDIAIDTGQIGGPSAGLAFALDIIDELGPTDIDHGERIVATGEIALDGTVSRSAGSSRKPIGARDAGADVFLVPGRQLARPRGSTRDGLRIVPVSNLRRGVARSGNTIVAASGNGCNVLGGNCVYFGEQSPSNRA